jgi:hypothetical protein
MESTTTECAPPEDAREFKPGDVHESVESLHKELKVYSRLLNFSVVSDKREKKKGSGLFRGKFTCSGSNTKQAHAACRMTPLNCKFCVPYTYNADFSVVVKDHCEVKEADGSGGKTRIEMTLEHSHTMIGVMNVTSAMGEVIRVKSMDNHLTDRERAFIGLFAGTHVSVADIQASAHTPSICQYLPVTASSCQELPVTDCYCTQLAVIGSNWQ